VTMEGTRLELHDTVKRDGDVGGLRPSEAHVECVDDAQYTLEERGREEGKEGRREGGREGVRREGVDDGG